MQAPQRDSTGIHKWAQTQAINVGRGPERGGTCIWTLAGATLLQKGRRRETYAACCEGSVTARAPFGTPGIASGGRPLAAGPWHQTPAQPVTYLARHVRIRRAML